MNINKLFNDDYNRWLTFCFPSFRHFFTNFIKFFMAIFYISTRIKFYNLGTDSSNPINKQKISTYSCVSNPKNNFSPRAALQSAIIWVKVWIQDCLVPGWSVSLANYIILLKSCFQTFSSDYNVSLCKVLRWSAMVHKKLTVPYYSFLDFPLKFKNLMISPMLSMDRILKSDSLIIISSI